jgi:predicted patatin/cPLA2 family phospholipase
MRGAVSGGMALALEELGLADAFDAAYGSSAGALNAMWLVSGRLRNGIPTWTDPSLVHELIDKRRVLRGGPIVDVWTLVEERYEKLSPGLFDAVLSASTELHPVATDVASGEAVDLHSTIADPASLRLALRATAALPLLAGPPISVDGSRYLDAGLSAAIPFRAALAGDATHVLVLRSRKQGEVASTPSRLSAAITGRLLERIDPAMARAFLTRAAREAIDEKFLAAHEADPSRTPHILSVRPAAESAVPSRLESDIDVIRAGLEAGRRALHEALGAPA